MRDLYQLFSQTYRALRNSLTALLDDAGLDAFTKDRRDEQVRRVLRARVPELVDNLRDSVIGLARDAVLLSYNAGYLGRSWSMTQSLLPDAPMQWQRVDQRAFSQRLGEDFFDPYALEFGKLALDLERLFLNVRAGDKGGAVLARARRILGIDDYRASFFAVQNLLRTQVMNASNIGALDLYTQNSEQSVREAVGGLGLLIIYLTANDRRVCSLCQPYAGRTWRADTVLGLAGAAATLPVPPLHAGCRCTLFYLPAPEWLLPDDFPPGMTWVEWLALNGLENTMDAFLGQRFLDTTQLGDAQYFEF